MSPVDTNAGKDTTNSEARREGHGEAARRRSARQDESGELEPFSGLAAILLIPRLYGTLSQTR